MSNLLYVSYQQEDVGQRCRCTRVVIQRIIRYNPFENTKYEKPEQKIHFLQKSDVAKLMALKVNDKDAE